jgi:dTDP-4-amino-4,6-dideoxygalactose transaminase
LNYIQQYMLRNIKVLDFEKEIKESELNFKQAFNRVLQSNWYILGKEVESFEKEFAEYMETKYCIGVGNGLEALQISLMALGIGQNDEVITTPISAVATTLAILAVGAKPIFVDTDENGLIDTSKIEPAITKKTKAILPVHLYGQAVNLDKIQQLCKKNKLFLIEDACQAHGSIYNGKKLGSFGQLNCFSFYPTKNLGAFGDGGAIVTNNKALDKICREIRDYGQVEKYVHIRYGLNSRLDELQAAFLKVKLKKLEQNNQKRRLLAKQCLKNLSNTNLEIVTQNTSENNFHQFVIRIKKRDQLQKFLKDNGIPTLIHYPITIPDQPFLKYQYGKLNIPAARQFVNETLSLPIHPYLTIKQVDEICEVIKKYQ